MGSPRLTTEAELQAAVRGPRVVVYLSVEWAGQERFSRKTFAQFVECIERDHSGLSVAFRVLGEECEGGIAWFRKAELPGSAGGGYGAVVWLDGGVVREVVVYAAAVGVEGLVGRTLALWGPAHRPGDVPADR
jgi:hypothetical protein